SQKKEALKKETQQSSKTIEKAIDEMEKKVEQSQNYQKTMERIAEQVKNDTEGDGEGNGGPYGAGGFSGPGSQQSDLLTIYAAEIYSYISKNWSYNEQLADGNVNLVALLGIKIMADGEIQKVWFDKKSGNGYFDEQALKAVLKTRYLPPLPAGFRKPFLEIGLRFTPSGIQ
ncbi:MAG: TonB C-terminal domain-containing protein, partial [Deltaproteobacteria bacterium]